MNGQRVAYWMRIVRTDEQHVGVSLTKRWWLKPLGRKASTADRRLMSFEFDATGMGEDDVLRAALSDALVYLGGGPHA